MSSVLDLNYLVQLAKTKEEEAMTLAEKIGYTAEEKTAMINQIVESLVQRFEVVVQKANERKTEIENEIAQIVKQTKEGCARLHVDCSVSILLVLFFFLRFGY